jgi:hypothetical protein
MTRKWGWTILGPGLGFCLVGLGFLLGSLTERIRFDSQRATVATRHDSLAQTWRASPTALEPPAPAQRDAGIPPPVRFGELLARRASETGARGTYWATLFCPPQQSSLDGLLRTAEAFAALGDGEMVTQCLRTAEGLAATIPGPESRERVRGVAARLTARPLGTASLH